MCRKKGCDMRMAGNCICCVICKCNETCFECFSANRTYNHYTKSTYQTPHYEPRNKYICFPCRRVWKSSVSKYQAQQADKNINLNEIVNINKINNKQPYNCKNNENYINNLENDLYKTKISAEEFMDNISNNSTYTYSRFERKTIRRVEKEMYIDAYTHNKSKCAKCGKNGLYVGRNFRPCNTEKEWKELEKNVENNPICLYRDFHDYPREGTKECYERYQKMRNQMVENNNTYCVFTKNN